MSNVTTLSDSELDAVSGGLTVNVGNGGLASNGAQISASVFSGVSVYGTYASVNWSKANANGGIFVVAVGGYGYGGSPA